MMPLLRLQSWMMNARLNGDSFYWKLRPKKQSYILRSRPSAIWYTAVSWGIPRSAVHFHTVTALKSTFDYLSVLLLGTDL
jgi:hypothetical protein